MAIATLQDNTDIQKIETAKLTLEQANEKVDEILNTGMNIDNLEAARSILVEAMSSVYRDIGEDTFKKWGMRVTALTRESIDRIVDGKDLKALVKKGRKEVKNLVGQLQSRLDIHEASDKKKEDEEAQQSQEPPADTGAESKEKIEPYKITIAGSEYEIALDDPFATHSNLSEMQTKLKNVDLSRADLQVLQELEKKLNSFDFTENKNTITQKIALIVAQAERKIQIEEDKKRISEEKESRINQLVYDLDNDAEFKDLKALITGDKAEIKRIFGQEVDITIVNKAVETEFGFIPKNTKELANLAYKKMINRDQLKNYTKKIVNTVIDGLLTQAKPSKVIKPAPVAPAKTTTPTTSTPKPASTPPPLPKTTPPTSPVAPKKPKTSAEIIDELNVIPGSELEQSIKVINVVNRLKEFNANKIKAEAKRVGVLWKDDYCTKLANWIKEVKIQTLNEIIDEVGTDKEMKVLQNAIESKGKILMDELDNTNLSRNLANYSRKLGPVKPAPAPKPIETKRPLAEYITEIKQINALEQWGEVIRLTEVALKDYPDSYGLNILRGNAASKLKKDKIVLESYENALKTASEKNKQGLERAISVIREKINKTEKTETAKQIPSNVNEEIRNAIVESAKSPKQIKLFVQALNIVENGSSALGEEDKAAIRNQMEAIRTVFEVETGDDVKKVAIGDALEELEKVLNDEKLKLVLEEPQLKQLKTLIESLSFAVPGLREKIEQFYAILEIDPDKYKDPTDKAFVEKLQEDIRYGLTVQIPKRFEEGKSFKGKTLDEKIAEINKLGLRQQVDKANCVADVVKTFDALINRFNEIESAYILANPDEESGNEPILEQSPTTSEGTTNQEQDIVTLEDTTNQSEAHAPTEEESGEEAEWEESRSEKKTKKPIDPEAIAEDLDEKIDAMIIKVLTDPEKYNVDEMPKDPASLAIRALVRHSLQRGQITLDGLRGFLYGSDNTIKQLEEAIQEKQDEIQQITEEANDEISNIKSDILQLQREKVKESDPAKRQEIQDEINAKRSSITDLKHKLRDDKKVIDEEIKEIKDKIETKKSGAQYNSTKQVLYMIKLYISEKNNKGLKEAEIMNQVDALVEGQREEAFGGSYISRAALWASSLGGILKPRLSKTLRNLVKDSELQEIGADNLAKLADIYDKPSELKSWFNKLKGNEKDKMTVILPKLIAYIETAIRNGNLTYIKAGQLEKYQILLDNIKKIRHKYVLERVKNRVGSSKLDPIDRMNIYFDELEAVTAKQEDINKSIITRGTYKNIATAAGYGALAVGAGIATGGIAPAVVTAIGAGGAIDLWIRGIKETDPKRKEQLKKYAARIGMTGAVGAGLLATGAVALATGPVGLAALAAAPLVGTFSPEIAKLLGLMHKNRKKIEGGAKATGRGAVKTAKVGYKVTRGALTASKWVFLTGITAGIYPIWRLKKYLTKGK